MDIDLGVVKVGLEVEVPAWENGESFYDVCGRLVKAGYMQEPVSQWKKHHKYHCNCLEGGCNLVRGGDVIVPPLVSMTYDASLPKVGAEFIISPIVLSELTFRSQLEEIINIITENAIWTMDMPNYNATGELCSPSIHLHVSANRREDPKGPRLTNREQGVLAEMLGDDLLQALSLFSPEMFLLASACGKTRGLKFRLPNRLTIRAEAPTGYNTPGHHGFIDVRRTIPDKMIHIEWRLFEAAYGNWEYLESAAYFSAGLTRSFLRRETLSRLMGEGYRDPYDDFLISKAVKDNDTSLLLSAVSPNRLEALRQIALESLHDDDHGMIVVNDLFAMAERNLR